MTISTQRMQYLQYLSMLNSAILMFPARTARHHIDALYAKLKELCDVLGIIVEKEAEILDADIEKLIKERQDARKEKNFAVRTKSVMNWLQWELF